MSYKLNMLRLLENTPKETPQWQRARFFPWLFLVVSRLRGHITRRNEYNDRYVRLTRKGHSKALAFVKKLDLAGVDWRGYRYRA